MSNSLTESPFIPTWAKDNKDNLFFIYNGPSMAPLFKPGDMLCAHKLVLESIHLGDIVIINWESDENRAEFIVHRVISKKQKHLITQGDNNLKPDLKIVTIENLMGKVISFCRQNHVSSVTGGALGLFYARFIHALNNIWLFIKRVCWRRYDWMRKSRLVARVWRPAISQICLITDSGPLIKYCYGNRTVACWWLESKKFDVIKPFDLVIPSPEELR